MPFPSRAETDRIAYRKYFGPFQRTGGADFVETTWARWMMGLAGANVATTQRSGRQGLSAALMMQPTHVIGTADPLPWYVGDGQRENQSVAWWSGGWWSGSEEPWQHTITTTHLVFMCHPS